MKLLAAPDTPLSEAVRASLEAWSAAGLLDPFCWWTIRGTAPDDALLLIENGRLTHSNLGQALRRRATDTDLVGILAAHTSSEFPMEFIAGLQAAHARLLRIVPADADYRPRQFLVVAPASADEPAPTETFRAALTNVVILPEDRAHPRDANMLPDHPELLAPHAAHAVASLAELFSGSPKQQPSLLETIAVSLGNTDVHVQEVSCYTRMIDGGYIADHIAADVLRPQEDGWPNPSTDKFERIDELDAPRLEHLVGRFFETHDTALGLSRFDPVKYEEPKLRLFEALKLFVRYLIDNLLRKPGEWLDATVGRLYDMAATRIERSAGSARGFSILRWREQPERRSFTETLVDLNEPLVAHDGPVGEAWTDLRKMSVGMIDGSPLPTFVEPVYFSHDGRRFVIPDPDEIVPDPRVPPPVAGDTVLRACDPLRLEAQASTGLAQGGSERGGIVEADPAPVENPALVYVQERHHTLVWRVGSFLGSTLRRAEQAAQLPRPAEHADEAGEDAEEEETPEQWLEKAERRIRRRFWLKALMVTALAAATGWYFVKNLPLLSAAGALVLTGVAWIVVLATLAFRAYRRIQAARKDVIEERLKELNAVLLALQRRGDVIRLDRRYKEYLDWAEMIGWLAHRPWVGSPASSESFQDGIDPDSLPSAFVVASGVIGDERRETLASQAANVVFEASWLEQLYHRIENASGREYLRIEESVNHPEEDGIPLPDTPGDLREDADAPRQYLLRAIRSGKYQRVTDSGLTGPLLESLSRLPIDDVFDGVVPVERGKAVGATTLPPTPAWLEPPPDLEELAADLRRSVVRVRAVKGEEAFGGTGVIIDDGGLVATNWHVVESADQVEVALADGSWVPATVQALSDTTDLALLGLPGDRRYPAIAISPNPARQGQPVVTMGHPKLVDGDPTLAWGIVSAARHRVEIGGLEDRFGAIEVISMTYPSAGGASGSPVIDGSGQLVGIHCAGAASDDSLPEYLASAVPTSEIESLLNGQQPLGIGTVNAAPTTKTELPSSFLLELIGASTPLPQLELGFAHPARLVASSPIIHRARPVSRRTDNLLPAPDQLSPSPRELA